MASLRITDSSDVERATLSISSYSIKREGFNVIPKADVAVSRSDLNSVSGLTPGEDRAYIEENGVDEFGGIIQSPERQGSTSVIKIPGMEQYLVRAPSVPTGQQKVGVDDSTLIEECIDATPELSAGTIETVEAGQTWVFGGVSQWEKATQVANAAGGELRVDPDRTVHYKAQIGSDKTGTTLSPTNGSFVENTFVVNRDGVSGNTTHLLVTGVGQGTGQIEVAIVPEDDSTVYSQYDRVETYSNPDWSDGDPAIWGQPRGNKDLKNADAAAAYAQSLISELQNAEVRVETRVKDEALELGDQYHVLHPEEDVDQDLRVVELVELLAAEGGRRFEVVFSNYEFAHRDPTREEYRNATRYGAGAYEGDLTNVQQSPGRGPVDSGHDYVLEVYYPDDVVSEVNAEVLVKGLNYRAYSAGTASGGGATSDPKDYDGAFEVRETELAGSTGSTSPTSTLTSVEADKDVTVSAAGTVGSSSDEPIAVFLRIYDGDSTSATKLAETGLDRSSDETFSMMVGAGDEERSNTDLTIEVEAIDTAQAEIFVTNTNATLIEVPNHKHDTPDHAHDPDPGILDWDDVDQSPAHYPEDVDIIVNGNSQGVSLGDGSGEFEETVDIAGELSTGWNTIRLTSNGLGHLDASFSADLFRQSL